ncbi:hypothetical protein N3K66_007641 [Trichothecium roseum]|uniref:Uncharacterized protein n=1 Tax=Trichothecium roseum TaxID=47278 RepID=A0ACC0UUI7_9HYPO|nr:hypothetical protein N3K66_007641 [Trichothecium roseum]
MVSDHVLRLCKETETVSSALANDPESSPGEIVKRLYGHHQRRSSHDRDESRPPSSSSSSARDGELALECGRWGPTTPSPLFLQAFADALKCLDADPMSGMVSPPLMGTHGTVPLTVFAPLVDVVRHCSNLIARAESDVFFVTCTWSPSVAQRLIRNALLELNRRVGERGGRRVVVKIMFDQAGAAHAVESHQLIKPSAYASKSIQLPAPEEVPNIDIELISMHNMMLGTLHAKFCIVDRKIAALMSNNIEDNENMEMMTHLEGPIVDSLYDTALIAWKHALHPSPPSFSNPESSAPGDTSTEPVHEPLYTERGPAARSQHSIAAMADEQAPLPEHTPESPHYDNTLEDEMRRVQSCYATKPDETRLQAANRQLNLAARKPVPATGPDIPAGQEMTPYISTLTAHPVPMALVSRPPYGGPGAANVDVPQNAAWLSLVRGAQRSIFIQTPDLNAAGLVPALAAALARGVAVTYYVCFGYNDAGEMIPGQGGTNEQAARRLLDALPADGPERDLLRVHDYVARDQDRPIHQSLQSRTCHVKLLVADGRVGVQGSGNQDTQSWAHSLEVNVMVDSEEVCRGWIEGAERNQNTRLFGAVAGDGVWRDREGRPAEGYNGDPGAVAGLLRGVGGMVRKVRDTMVV